MWLTEFAVKRFQFMLVMFLLLVAVGFHAMLNIPRAEDPAFPIPMVIVVATYPGADPEDIEKLVIDPLEKALNETSDIKEIRSTARDGQAIVTVEYDWSKDPDKKYDEAVREINAARGKLPADLASLFVTKANPGLTSILQLALVGPNTDARRLQKTARRLQERLEQVHGVRTVEVSGLAQSEVQVAIDLPRLAKYGVPLTQVVDTLRSENALVPGGAVESGTRRFNLRTSGNFASLEEIASTIIASSGTRIVRLKDVAAVRWGYDEERYVTRYNGQRAVFINVTQKDDMNIFNVRDAVVAEVDRYRAELSPDMRLAVGFDQSRNVESRLNRLAVDFAIAIGLVMVTLVPLGLRAAGVVMVSIPLSMAIGVALLYFAGFSLNQLSIAGFVLALGLLVDDSIVVTENIERFLRQGHSRMEAAILATRQIHLAVIGCTATLLFAFLPLFMLPEGAGKYIKSLAASISFTIVASLLVALTVIPFLASRLLERRKEDHGSPLLRWVMRGIRAFYGPQLRLCLAYPKTAVAIAGVLFVGVLGLVPVVGVSLFPQADVPQFLVSVEMPEGSAIGETDRAVRHVEQKLLAHPEVAHVFSNAGRGNPRNYYNEFRTESRPNVGDLFVELKRYDPRTTPALYDQLRQELADYPQASLVVKPFENGPVVAAPIAIRILGPRLDTLGELAGEVERVIKSVPGTRNVSNPLRLARTDLDLNIDTTKASLYGVPTIAIDRTVRLAVAGETIGQFREADGDESPITLRAPMTGGRQNLGVLDEIYVNSVQGTALPLRSLIDPQLRTAPTTITRYKRQRSVTVTAYPSSGYNTEKLTGQIVAKLEAQALPAGYRFMVAGEREARNESFAGLGVAALIAVFGILAVLVLEFGDFRSTIVVAGVIPLGIIGGMLALFLSGYSLSFMAVIGFIALIGIEIKNSILLVDFTHQLRQEGKGLMEAIQEAGEVRFLPILLTSLTAIGGLLPLALQGSSLYSPLAWVIIGGLASSTFLARLVTPAMYCLLAPPLEKG